MTSEEVSQLVSQLAMTNTPEAQAASMRLNAAYMHNVNCLKIVKEFPLLSDDDIYFEVV
jgi:hypothetical protein